MFCILSLDSRVERLEKHNLTTAESSACESSEAAIKRGEGGLKESLDTPFIFGVSIMVQCTFERNKQHYLKGFSFTFPIEWIN